MSPLLQLTCNELEGLGNVATEIVGVRHLDFRHLDGVASCDS